MQAKIINHIAPPTANTIKQWLTTNSNVTIQKVDRQNIWDDNIFIKYKHSNGFYRIIRIVQRDTYSLEVFYSACYGGNCIKRRLKATDYYKLADRIKTIKDLESKLKAILNYI